MKKRSTSESADGASGTKKPKISKQNDGAEHPVKKQDKVAKKHGSNAAPAMKNAAKASKGTLKAPYNIIKNKKHPASSKKSNKLDGKHEQTATQDKPQDWNEFKKQKRELLKKRKGNRSLIDIITKAKRLGEKLCVKEIKGGPTEREKLVNELHRLIGNQGNYVKFVLSHDMSRIVQYIIKFATMQIRKEISTEVLPETVTMLQSKYGKYVFRHLLKYGNAEIRTKCIKSMYGNAVKLASHAVSAPIFEYAYTTFASPQDKVSLTLEFFGDMFKHSKQPDMHHIRDVYENAKELKVATLSAAKANLERIINKSLFDSAIVHTVCSQFLDECSPEDRSELISQLCPHVVVLSNSKDGCKVAMRCFWQGTNKERKKVVKAIKEHVGDMCAHEHAHIAIIALLDSADDTVLVNKSIVSEIVTHSQDLIANRWGRRVLTWIVSPGDTKQFHPQFVRELEAGRATSSCKKDVKIRQKEILDFNIKGLIEKIVEAPRNWCVDVNRFLVLSAVLQCEGGREHAFDAFKCIAALLTDPECKIDGQVLIEHPGIHMCLKSLVKSDKAITGKKTFGRSIIAVMNDDVITKWISVNRGCFLLLHVFRNNKRLQVKLTDILKPHLQALEGTSSKGAELLLEHLNAM